MKKAMLILLALCSSAPEVFAAEFSYWWSAPEKFQWSIRYGEWYQKTHHCLVDRKGHNNSDVPALIGWARESDITGYIKQNCKPLTQPNQQTAKTQASEAPAKKIEEPTPPKQEPAKAADDGVWSNPIVYQGSESVVASRWVEPTSGEARPVKTETIRPEPSVNEEIERRWGTFAPLSTQVSAK
jgi:hypothetical protein